MGMSPPPAVSPPAGRRRAPSVGSTAPLEPGDLDLLGFAAAQRLFQRSHAQALLGAGAPAADRSLERLRRAALVEIHEVFRGEEPAYTITRGGLRLLGRSGSAPRLDLSVYAHDLGVAWLWLAARRGRWGEARALVGERELRARHVLGGLDGGGEELCRAANTAASTGGAPNGPAAPVPAPVALAGPGPAGRPRLHYPDLGLVLRGGRQLALELELSAKGPARMAGILNGYALSGYDTVIYLVERAAVAEAVQRAARRRGMDGCVHVQPFRWGGPVPARGSAARPAGRVPAAARGAPAEHLP